AEIKKKLTSLEEKNETIAKCIDAAEGCISETEDKLYHLENTNTHIETELQNLRNKCKDLENRARRSNLRIVGIPEGVEGRDPVSFIEKFLPTILGEDTFPDKMEVEQAYQVFGAKPKTGERPLAFIIKLLRFSDKERAMRKVRDLGQLTWNNSKIFLFPDLSVELLASRECFHQAKQMCHEKKVKFALQYPAKLHLNLATGPKYFSDRLEAEEFLRLHPSDTKIRKIGLL
uniref:L1 transposable element RRM domain-containing protein n=1 Tax=Latimeria chalumnae TaxID=7897 RepID=H3AC33_LATCH